MIVVMVLIQVGEQSDEVTKETAALAPDGWKAPLLLNTIETADSLFSMKNQGRVTFPTHECTNKL